MNDATNLFKQAEPGSPQLALGQLITGLLHVHQPETNVVLDVLLSLYRHVILQSPGHWADGITGLQAITAELAQRQHLLELSQQISATKAH